MLSSCRVRGTGSRRERVGRFWLGVPGQLLGVESRPLNWVEASGLLVETDIWNNAPRETVKSVQKKKKHSSLCVVASYPGLLVLFNVYCTFSLLWNIFGKRWQVRNKYVHQKMDQVFLIFTYNAENHGKAWLGARLSVWYAMCTCMHLVSCLAFA